MLCNRLFHVDEGKTYCLIKTRAKETISQLPDNIEYQLIFSQVQLGWQDQRSRANTKAGVVEFEGEDYKWKGNDMFNWYQQGRSREGLDYVES